MDISKMTKKHYTRLRHYWGGGYSGTSGGASLADTIDLDLAGHGLIQRTKLFGTVYFTITTAGEKELYLEKQREIERRKPHHDLGTRFAKYLQDNGKITWENIEFRIEDIDSAGNKTIQCVRPDVFSMLPTFNIEKMNPCCYEIKVSRSDFLVDLKNPEKRGAAMKISEAMYYVCPKDMIKVSEIPDGFGLIYEKKIGEFEIVKKVRKKRVTLSPQHFMNLILKKGKFNSIND